VKPGALLIEIGHGKAPKGGAADDDDEAGEGSAGGGEDGALEESFDALVKALGVTPKDRDAALAAFEAAVSCCK